MYSGCYYQCVYKASESGVIRQVAMSATVARPSHACFIFVFGLKIHFRRSSLSISSLTFRFTFDMFQSWSSSAESVDVSESLCIGVGVLNSVNALLCYDWNIVGCFYMLTILLSSSTGSDDFEFGSSSLSILVIFFSRGYEAISSYF